MDINLVYTVLFQIREFSISPYWLVALDVPIYCVRTSYLSASVFFYLCLLNFTSPFCVTGLELARNIFKSGSNRVIFKN
jgi:hypothetical protein